MGDEFDLSVVVELDTKEITGRGGFRARLDAWVEQLRALDGRRVELLLCGSEEFTIDLASTAALVVRPVHAPGAHYYGLKNAGANAARGAVVFFTDSDCRPCPGAVAALLRAFEDPEVRCVFGRTRYDGDDPVTLVNTAWSFGYVHATEALRFPQSPLSHGVALRRSVCPRDPFRPFDGRMGGDLSFARHMAEAGIAMVHAPGLEIRHENLTFSLRGTLERHLREHFVAAAFTPDRGLGGAAVLRQAALGHRHRLDKLRRYGAAVGVGRRHWPLAAAMIAVYAVFDVVAVAAVLAVPALHRRWCAFLFGDELAARLRARRTPLEV